MSFGFGMGAISGGGGVSARSVPVASSSTGRVVALTRLLGSASTFSLLSGTDASITLDSGNGLAVSTGVAAGTSVIAQVREQVGSGATARAVEYAVKISGTPVKPSVPAVTLTAGNGQISVAWADGSNGGSAILQHNIYDNGVLIGSPTGAGPFVISGLPNDVLHGPIQVSAVNGVGEGALSTGQSAKPSAVTFRLDNAINLQRWGGLRTPGALGVTETSYGVLSFWMRGSVGSPTTATTTQFYTDKVRMLMGNDSSDTQGTAEGSAGFNILLDNASTGGVESYGTLRMNYADAGSTNNSTAPGKTNHSWEATKFNVLRSMNGQWVHVLLAWDARYTAPNKRIALYVNGVNQQIQTTFEDGTLANPFIPNINVSKGWQFNYWGDPSIGLNGGMSEYAQVLLDISTPIVQPPSGGYCSIDPAIVAKFYNNGPVDYGANGANPLGFQPQFFWDGDKSAFLVNKGTQGAAGNLSAVGTTPYVSSSGFGPSGLKPGYVGHIFTADSGGPQNANLANASTTGLRIHLGANNIQAGDLLILMAHSVDNSGANVDHGFALPTDAYGGTWNQLGSYRANGGTGNQTDLQVYWKLATAADVSAASAGTWTGQHTCTTAPTRSWQWAMFGYRGVDQTTPIGASTVTVQSKTNSGGGTNPITPSVTTTKANSTILQIVSSWQVGTITPPSQPNLRFHRYAGAGSFPFLSVGDEVQASIGASTQRTWNYTIKDPSQAVAIVLNPA